MEKRTKGCLWIGLGIAIVVVMVVVAVIAGAGFWAYQTFAPDAVFVDQAKADQQLEDIRARFKNRTPLMVTGEHGRDARLQTEGREATFTGQLQALHVAVYDRRAGKLVRFSMPFWLVRLAPDGKVSIGDGALDGVRGAEKLTVKDLEALGPGLIVDERKPDGDRVLVWTE
jgi:hypothetical protein